MNHHPTEITLRKRSRLLVVRFESGETFELPFEYLRVFSPSAEVQGHGPGQEVLQVGKENVDVRRIEPIGSYAIRIEFDDGHNTGIYSWDVLFELGRQQENNWQSYLKRLDAAGYQRVAT